MSDVAPLGPDLAGIVWLSLEIAFTAIICSLPLAVAAAWLLARTRFPGQALFEALVFAPLVLPPVAIGYFLLVVFGHNGIVGGWLYRTFGLSFIFTREGAMLAAGVMAFPLVVRGIRLSLDAVDRGLEVAARTLGGRPWDVFLSVTLPLMLPGILSGAIVGFARALGEFGATITFASNIEGETRTLPLALYTAVQTPNGDALALALVGTSLVLALAALIVSDWLERRVRLWLGRSA